MYSPIVVEHFFSPRNVGVMDDPDVVGKSGSKQEGEFIILHLKLNGDKIREARFKAFGCGPAIAACSVLTEWTKGKTRQRARKLTPQKLIEMLGGLPQHKLFCASLAVDALKNALKSL